MDDVGGEWRAWVFQRRRDQLVTGSTITLGQ